MAEKMTERGTLSGDLHALLDLGEGADVVLVVGGSEVQAHSHILAARSPVFAAMLRSDMREARRRRIEICDVREQVLQQLLSFMYKDEASELEIVAAELLVAADKYDLPLLRQKCEQQLVQGLNVENAADTAGLAVLYNCPELKMAAVQYISWNPRVLATAGWARLLRENTVAAVEVSEQLAAAVRLRTATFTNLMEKQVLSKEQVLSEKLVAAASEGQTDEVRAFLAEGAPVDGKDASGWTALSRAALNCYEDTVRFLIDAGADVNARSYSGWTPLHIAAQDGPEHIVCMLTGASASVNVQDDYGDTPLHVAARKGYVSATEALLRAGARRDVRNIGGMTPAGVAASNTRELFSS